MAARGVFDGDPAVWVSNPALRRTVLLKTAELMRENAEALAQMVSLEVGMPMRQARPHVAAATDVFDFYAGYTGKAYGEAIRLPSGSQIDLFREPVGVVGMIVPWNFPLTQAARKLAPAIAVGCALMLPLGRSMNLLSLGEPSAQSLGVDVRRLRWQLIGLSTVLTALATAVGGVVGFVGLVVPHLLRLAFGPDHRRLLPLSMLGGAALVLLCDLPTRFLPGGIRLGVMTALLGGPFLLWMLRRNPC